METKIPKTKNEAFAQLDAILSEKEKSELVKSDAIKYHFSLGMWIRNNWIYEQEEEDVKRLAKDLHLISQFHNLFQHTLFAITDFIYVRKFKTEINIEIIK